MYLFIYILFALFHLGFLDDESLVERQAKRRKLKKVADEKAAEEKESDVNEEEEEPGLWQSKRFKSSLEALYSRAERLIDNKPDLDALAAATSGKTLKQRLKIVAAFCRDTLELEPGKQVWHADCIDVWKEKYKDLIVEAEKYPSLQGPLLVLLCRV